MVLKNRGNGQESGASEQMYLVLVELLCVSLSAEPRVCGCSSLFWSAGFYAPCVTSQRADGQNWGFWQRCFKRFTSKARKYIYILLYIINVHPQGNVLYPMYLSIYEWLTSKKKYMYLFNCLNKEGVFLFLNSCGSATWVEANFIIGKHW